MTPQEINAAAKKEAQRIAKTLKVPWQWIWGQWAYECYSNGQPFGSSLAMSNLNLAGIGGPGNWRRYYSVKQFADDYANLLSKEYPQATGAKSIDAFALALSQHKGGGSYYGSATPASYAAGIKARVSLLGDDAAAASIDTSSGETISQHKLTPADKIRAWYRDFIGKNYPDADTPEAIIEARKGEGLDTSELETAAKKFRESQDRFSLDSITGFFNTGLWVVIGLVLLALGVFLLIKSPVIDQIKGGITDAAS